MKRKRFIKKLVLNKETVSNLADNDLDLARGGVTALCTTIPCITQGQECETRETRCIVCPD
jgi:hypothetical protein